MSTLSLCSGVGALDLAVSQVTGQRTAVYAETDPWAARVLADRFPGVPNLGDIAGTDWATLTGDVDTVIAGWPCQGISHNGHRLGLDDPRSGLWRCVAQAIDTIRPARVFLENVAALKTRGLPTVAAHLNSLGYDLYWTITTAAAVGGAHNRPRWFGYAVPPLLAAAVLTAATGITTAAPATLLAA
ncbi:DNA cytosine methyltransferase [Streptomyces albus]|uniref:DNA cytosine methyltransferase n=1 Tax=Streptomyces albus TaxID=1888 RepID=UPI0037A71EFA